MLAQLELIAALAEGGEGRVFLRRNPRTAAIPRAAQSHGRPPPVFVTRGLLWASSVGRAATGCAYRVTTGQNNCACCAATGMSRAGPRPKKYQIGKPNLFFMNAASLFQALQSVPVGPDVVECPAVLEAALKGIAAWIDLGQLSVTSFQEHLGLLSTSAPSPLRPLTSFALVACSPASLDRRHHRSSATIACHV